MSAPEDLGTGGRALWLAITEAHEIDETQHATLQAACRQRDRADMLSSAAAEGDLHALRHERDASLAMTRLLVALRLPDAQTGKRPQYRGTRGVQKPTAAAVSSLDRARARAMG